MNFSYALKGNRHGKVHIMDGNGKPLCGTLCSKNIQHDLGDPTCEICLHGRTKKYKEDRGPNRSGLAKEGHPVVRGDEGVAATVVSP